MNKLEIKKEDDIYLEVFRVYTEDEEIRNALNAQSKFEQYLDFLIYNINGFNSKNKDRFLDVALELQSKRLLIQLFDSRNKHGETVAEYIIHFDLYESVANYAMERIKF